MSLTSKEIIELTNKYGANNYAPLEVVIQKAEGCWVWDPEGKKYLDMLSSYSAINHGHRHPEILKAMIEQTERVTLTSRAFHNDRLYELLEKIAKVTKKEKVLPMNSGAEAVETALKIIRKWAYLKKGIPENKAEIIVSGNNFHGRTITIISFSTEEQYKKGFGPFTPGFKVIPFGDIKVLEEAINENTAAFLTEPIQGEGGIIVPPEGFLKQAKELCEKHNVLLAVDEIQTGLGRTGKMFAFEYDNIEPDVIIIGKALGGGVYPVSAVACNNDIMDVIKPGDHGSTFGGNPLAAAVGVKSLEIIERDDLPGQAMEKGKYFMDELRKIDHPQIKEIRGRGLLIGLELHKGDKNAHDYCEELREEGVLCKDTHDTVIRFAPPLVITKEEMDFALDKIRKIFSK